VDQHKYLIDQKIPMKLFYLTEQYIFIKMSALFDKDKFLKFNKALNKRWNLFSWKKDLISKKSDEFNEIVQCDFWKNFIWKS
jgi:hypothetical protein